MEEYLKKCDEYEEQVKKTGQKNPESKDRIYDKEGRWAKQLSYQEPDFDAITNPKKLLKFLEESLDGRKEIYFSKSLPKEKKYAEKIIG